MEITLVLVGRMVKKTSGIKSKAIKQKTKDSQLFKKLAFFRYSFLKNFRLQFLIKVKVSYLFASMLYESDHLENFLISSRMK